MGKVIRKVGVLSLSALLLLCCLAGCGSTSGSTQSGPQSATSSGTSGGEAGQAEPLQPWRLPFTVIKTGLSDPWAGDEAGCYTMVGYGDVSADILYIDYAAQQMAALDAPPKQDEAVLGHLYPAWGGAVPAVGGDALYVFALGAGMGPDRPLEQDGAVTRMARDGTDPVVVQLPAGWVFNANSALVDDGEAVWCTAWHEDEEGNALSSLVRLDFEARNAEVVHTFEAGNNYSIEGAAGGILVMHETTDVYYGGADGLDVELSDRHSRLFLFSPTGGEGATLCTFRGGENLPAVADGVLYEWVGEDNRVRATDVATGDVTTLRLALDPEAAVERVWFWRETVDGRVVMNAEVAGENGPQRTYAIDPATGEARTAPLEGYGYGAIIAETSTHFLLLSGEKQVSADLDGDGVWQEISERTYALIAKDDYWAGTPNLLPIEDLFYV